MKTEERETVSPPYFRVWLCEALRVERRIGGVYKGIRTAEWGGSNYPRLLLKVLLCCPGRQARRESLLEMLWPDTETELATQHLNTATTKLRLLLRPSKEQESLLRTEYDAAVYHLEGQSLLWVDTDAALALLKEAEQPRQSLSNVLLCLERALESFGAGMFLQDEEGQWAVGRRATIERAHYRCRHWLAQIYEQQGMPGQAEIVLSALLEEDALDEDVVCQLMGLLHRQGMTHQALQVYEKTCRVFLDEDLKVSEGTKGLARSLRQERHSFAATLDVRERAIHSLSEGALALHAANTERNPAFSLAHMQHTAPALTQGLLLPVGSAISPSLESASMDVVPWLSTRVSELLLLRTSQESAYSCQHHQSSVYEELKRWDTMTDQNTFTGDEFRITRRMALATLATFPVSLSKKLQSGNPTTLDVEDFLAQAATSITTCWHLLNGDTIAVVEYSLPRYLPLLISLAQHSSAYQKRAAYLASQGCLLMDLLAYHRFTFQVSLAYAQQAVELARVSGERNLEVYALILLGGAYYLCDQPGQMLHYHQEAKRYLHEVVPLLRSYAFACNGQVQEALRHIGQARDCFPSNFRAVPNFLEADYGLFQLIQFEGQTHLALGETDIDHTLHHSKQAHVALAQVETLSSSMTLPQRSRVEIINLQTTAAIKERNRELVETFLPEGARGAHSLGSEKRRQEVIANWRLARSQWPGDTRILDLADTII